VKEVNYFFMVIKKTEDGYILISVLFFLTVLYLLVTGLMEVALLESKMSANYAQQIENLYATDQALIEYEQKILEGNPPSNAKIIQPVANSSICGVTYYRVTATHAHGMNSTQIESTYAKLGDISKCNPKPIVQEGRQSFRLVEQ